VWADSWSQAFEAGKACPVMLESTHQGALQKVELEKLLEFAIAAKA
jgi:uncharacterized protein (DUF2237 family)